MGQANRVLSRSAFCEFDQRQGAEKPLVNMDERPTFPDESASRLFFVAYPRFVLTVLDVFVFVAFFLLLPRTPISSSPLLSLLRPLSLSSPPPPSPVSAPPFPPPFSRKGDLGQSCLNLHVTVRTPIFDGF